MNLHFYKYQGTGNDFVIIDNRQNIFKKDTKLINHICSRRFGVGADGLILLEDSKDENLDFKMVYYNSDGRESTMCGNGGRCIVAFAKRLNIIENHVNFEAIDGLHQAEIKEDLVNLKMADVPLVNIGRNATFLDTGSPHHIEFVKNLNEFNVKEQGRRIRNLENYSAIGGANVNFVEISEDSLHVRTYERGVEDETWSCGTGVTAAAIAAKMSDRVSDMPVKVITKGGQLNVNFELKPPNGCQNIWLKGPATFVFEGEISC
ncbi:diaminopimelate epimerase [Psychroflexus aestuariivivens]|uniref:diaminopimelate epimerase n=1 Tax=Psychroflexus aestuariivivens TaxID=1795040 RepID=UPI000FD75B88|nr:diaminopimelate epimerase [Psychroflexus aestuariivivens]